MERVLRSVEGFHQGVSDDVRSSLQTLARDGQKPEVMVITCADSRILIDPLVEDKPGVAFVIRNIGNLVPLGDGDPSVAAAVDYAVDHLKIPDIVIMGHSECGAMKAALGPNIDGPIGRWLSYADESVDTLEGDESTLPAHDRLSQHNVLVQAERLRAMETVKAAGVEVHAWWWDIAAARVLSYDGKRFSPMNEAYPDLQDL